MRRIKVLVVEDSATVRQRLVEIVNSDPELELVGDAEDGSRGIELAQSTRPDVITMDMMLPVMSGLAATEYIMAHQPTPILVVSASINRGELFKIYEALAAGAVDVLEKPTGNEPDGEWERRFLATVKLVARIRVITHPRARLAQLRGRAAEANGSAHPPAARPVAPAFPSLSAFSPPASAAVAPVPAPASRRQGHPFSLVAIGASTGGPGALVEMLRGLPERFQLPVLIVLHINEPFGTAFADWLDGQTTRRVVNARDGMPIASLTGRVAVAPGNRHLIVRDGRLRLTDGPERNSCRPSVDVLFESVADEYGPYAAACLLTGMGRDGARGLLRIRDAGGTTIAQDEASSVVYGMPREAALIGAAQQILRLGEIARRLASLTGVVVAEVTP